MPGIFWSSSAGALLMSSDPFLAGMVLLASGVAADLVGAGWPEVRRLLSMCRIHCVGLL